MYYCRLNYFFIYDSTIIVSLSSTHRSLIRKTNPKWTIPINDCIQYSDHPNKKPNNTHVLAAKSRNMCSAPQHLNQEIVADLNLTIIINQDKQQQKTHSNQITIDKGSSQTKHPQHDSTFNILHPFNSIYKFNY